MSGALLKMDGGLHTELEPFAIADNECESCLNVSFHKSGSMQTRRGYKRANLTKITGGNKVTGIAEYTKEDGTIKRLVKSGTSLYTFTVAGTDLATIGGSILTGMADGFLSWFVTFGNKMLIFDKAKNYVYDGTNITELGRDAPVAGNITLTAGVGGGSMTAGVYSYFFVYYSTSLDIESTASAVKTVALAGGQNQVAVSFAASVTNEIDAVWDKIRVYRSLVDGTTYFRHSAQTGNFTDTSSDASISVNATLSDTSYFKLPGARCGAEYLGRAWAIRDSEPTNVYYSEAGFPDRWKSSNSLRVGDQDGDHVLALLVTHGRLYAAKNNSLYQLVGTDTTAFYWQKIEGALGCTAGHGVTVAQGVAYVYDTEHGIYRFIGATVERMGRKIYESARADFVRSGANDFVYSSYEPRTEAIWWSVRRLGQSNNDRVLVFNKRTRAWSIYDIPCSAMGLIHRDNGDLRLMLGDHNGYLYWAEEGTVNAGPTGTVRGVIDDDDGGTLADSDASFLATGDKLVGMTLTVVKATTFAFESVSITGNAGTTIDHDAFGTVVPDTGDTYYIGAIDTTYLTKLSAFGDPFGFKKLPWYKVAFERQASAAPLRSRMLTDQNSAPSFNATVVNDVDCVEYTGAEHALRAQVELRHIANDAALKLEAVLLAGLGEDQRR